MARKVTTGIVGAPILGNLNVRGNLITTIGTNANLTVNPNGTGTTLFSGNASVQSAGSLKLNDSDNSNFIGLKAPGTLSGDYTLTLPNGYGSANSFLQTDGAGNLTWGTAAISITDDTTTNANRYVTFVSTSSGSFTGVNVTSSKLLFNPSTGALTITGPITGGTAASDQLILRSTTSGSKGYVYIDETTASSSTTSGALRVGGGVGIGGACYVGGALSAQSLTETSSIALKENINPIESALEKLQQLTGVTYDRKNGSTKNEAGLIAEHVNNVLPNIVTKDMQGNPEGINYTKLTAYLVEAVKTLKKELDDLKGRK